MGLRTRHLAVFATLLLVACGPSETSNAEDPGTPAGTGGAPSNATGATGSGSASGSGAGGAPATTSGGAPATTSGGAPATDACSEELNETRRLAASSPQECRKQGAQCGIGGAVAVSCDTVSVEFDPPLAASTQLAVETDVDVRVLVGASNGNCDESSCITAALTGQGQVGGLTLSWGIADEPNPLYGDAFPSEVTVSLLDESAQVTATKTAALVYSCEVQDPWRWCWKAAPVQMDLVTPAEP